MRVVKSKLVERKYSVFITTFFDDSVYFSSKIRGPESAKASFKWARDQKNNRPLVQRYLKYNGEAESVKFASGVSKLEAELIKYILIESYLSHGHVILNIKMKKEILLNSKRISFIQRQCMCGYNRAVELTSIIDKLISNKSTLATDIT
ncbi:hypothetical protein GCM10007978_17990 [Shewanella hanedai]|uniref:Uncharacterized protein n=1 Tax=Shewanella hanedai TaxID=25 RepID=A0A553JSU1_SHEHA|nr:hypothetical protein [Shewanella hanedai]TRY15524.1 hypothetical protein FN961_05565 [Shewanella hanedai]GGI80475.1 hypothetical protein GCM10007978_17990 [Shewanella hanedai]